MGLTILPTKTDGSIGRPKLDAPNQPPYDPVHEQNAAEIEQLKTALIDACTEVGLHDGSTPGSLVNLQAKGIKNVRAFGAIGDGIVDDTVAIQAALDAAYNSGSGGAVYLPSGLYKTTAPLLVPLYVSIFGDGLGSALKSFHSGDVVTSLQTVNGSTGVFHTFADFAVVADSSVYYQGGGIVDVAGTYVFIRNIVFGYLKYGIVFDQTEVGSIVGCNFGACTRGIWLCNGGEHTPSALSGFTNNISITGNNQFNGCGFGIADDGGAQHVISDLNIEGCTIAGIHLANVQTGIIRGIESETVNPVLVFDYQSATGYPSGTQYPIAQSTNVQVSNNFLAAIGNSPIHIVSSAFLYFENNFFAGCTVGVIGVNNSAYTKEISSFSETPGFHALDQHPIAGYAESWVGQPTTGLFRADYPTALQLNNLANKNDSNYNVVDYGLVGDGVTANDAAFNTLRTLITGKAPVIFFPRGTFLFNAEIAAFPVGCTFKGSPETIILLADSRLANPNTAFINKGWQAAAAQTFDTLYFKGGMAAGLRSNVVTGATNANPIVITTAAAHNYITGDTIDLYGILGNAAANTTAVVTKLSATTFSIPVAGNGAYSNAAVAITGATNANPIVITAVGHGLRTGQLVNIAGVTGNTNANGLREVGVLTADTFALYTYQYLSIGVPGNAAYTGGGTVLFGGVCLAESRLNYIGVNVVGPNFPVDFKNCVFDSFKYQISIDGGEECHITNCNFGAETGALTNELFTDHGNYSAYAIRIGLWFAPNGEAANVLHIDECHFVNSLYAILHSSGAVHTVTRCNFEQAVVATVQNCNTVVYEKCSNDGSGRDIFQLQSDFAGGSLFNFAIRDGFWSGSRALAYIGRIGFPIAAHGFTFDNNVWNGTQIPIGNSHDYISGFTARGNYCPSVASITDGYSSVENDDLGSGLGMPVNHATAPSAALDINYPSTSSGTPAIRIKAQNNDGYVLSDKTWKTTVSGVFAGTAQSFDNVLSSLTAKPGARLGSGMGWAAVIHDAGVPTQQIGVTDLTDNVTSIGTITMTVTAFQGGAVANISIWTIKQRYIWAGGVVPVLEASPYEVETNDNIGLVLPTMTVIGTYPSTPVQIVGTVTADAVKDVVYSVKFIVDQCGL